MIKHLKREKIECGSTIHTSCNGPQSRHSSSTGPSVSTVADQKEWTMNTSAFLCTTLMCYTVSDKGVSTRAVLTAKLTAETAGTYAKRVVSVDNRGDFEHRVEDG